MTEQDNKLVATPNDKPISHWRITWGKIFPKSYSATRIMLVFIIVGFFLSIPIQPKMPKKSELHELEEKIRFQHVNTMRSGSATYFFVGDEIVHCDIGALGGGNACDQFSDWIDVKRPARITYFWMRSHFFINAKILNSLEQDGRVIISSDDSFRLRTIFFNAHKESEWILPSLFGLLTIFTFLIERSAIRYQATRQSHD